MSTNIKIKELLHKFKHGELSPLESKELVSFIKEGDKNEDIKNILAEYWKSPVQGNYNIPVESMLRKIQEEIPERKHKILHPRTGFRIPRFVKYAAVILVTIGITLSARSIFINITKKQVLAEQDDNSIISVSYGSKSKVVLPDGTKVSLNSGSTLKYPAKFSKISRNVYVEGEAYFDVTKDKKHPFYVKTRDITIKVLGTKFNVKAYTDENIIQTTLVSGCIEIFSNKKEMSAQNRIVALRPNQQVTFVTNSAGEINMVKEAEKQNLKPVLALKPIKLDKHIDVTPVIAWKDNRLVFRDENFNVLARRLERWYNVEIEIKDDNLKTALFSGIFVNETVEQALNALKLATPFKYEMKKNHITIYK
jgi:transmembrane sensor